MKLNFFKRNRQIKDLKKLVSILSEELKRYKLPIDLTGRKIILRSAREIFDKAKEITEKRCEAERKEMDDLSAKYRIQESVLKWVLGGENES